MELGRRGPSRKILQCIVDTIELTLKEMDTLREICWQDNVCVDWPDCLKAEWDPKAALAEYCWLLTGKSSL